MHREHITRTEAERRVREEDQRRAHSIRQFYDADWNAPDPFHMILNTALWSQEMCVNVVLNAVEAMARQSRSDDCVQLPTDAQ
jgi:cytidylate kinase